MRPALVRIAVVVMAIAITTTACGSERSSLLQLDSLENGLTACQFEPSVRDLSDRVMVVQVLSYGPPQELTIGVDGEEIVWERVEVDTSPGVEVEQYVLRANGLDSVIDLFSSTGLGGMVPESEIRSVIDKYGDRLPASYVAAPDDGVIIVLVGRISDYPPGEIVSIEVVGVEYTVGGRLGYAVPDLRAGYVDVLNQGETAASVERECGPDL